ncbi:NAD-dependent epimerase/dehydratase family protein [Ideonella sp. YS5]|uniref:NAD-dependent epimerase/dehydratase family protein n=1 Tax=Ideonella sp. YS5 TaxID=3453714 RepID=UPI003EEF7C10
MHVLVTGAAGFVGQALVQRLLSDASATAEPLTGLTAIDQSFGDLASWRADRRLAMLEGDFADPRRLDAALGTRVDLVFHLASVPGSLAEREPALGARVNLQATLSLFDRVASAGGEPPRVVFASSIAVYGAMEAGAEVDESTAPNPSMSYGAHKLMAEIQLADSSRRGLLDGVSLRLPGIVARPASASGHGSAFMSDLIRRLHAGEPYECPVSPQARCWWMSRPRCVDNLLLAARLPAAGLSPRRVVQLPVISAAVGDVAEAAARVGGRPPQLRWRPDAALESIFGRMPPLQTPIARGLGFADDGSLDELVRNALA